MKMIIHMDWTEEGGRTVLKISHKSEICDLVVHFATWGNTFNPTTEKSIPQIHMIVDVNLHMIIDVKLRGKVEYTFICNSEHNY